MAAGASLKRQDPAWCEALSITVHGHRRPRLYRGSILPSISSCAKYPSGECEGAHCRPPPYMSCEDHPGRRQRAHHSTSCASPFLPVQPSGTPLPEPMPGCPRRIRLFAGIHLVATRKLSITIMVRIDYQKAIKYALAIWLLPDSLPFPFFPRGLSCQPSPLSAPRAG